MKSWKIGIYMHSTGRGGKLGDKTSTGSLLILDSQWNDFNIVMQGVPVFLVKITRLVIIRTK